MRVETEAEPEGRRVGVKGAGVEGRHLWQGCGWEEVA